ncbi:MAG: DNA-3-methyladenine glycosylase [Pseudomonadota bacterium]
MTDPPNIDEVLVSAPPDNSLRPALEALSDVDADMARLYRSCGLPPVRGTEPGFAGLISIIVGQQVSTHAAAAILDRLRQALPKTTADGFLELTEQDLRDAGFSRAKIRYGRALADAVVAGDLDFGALDQMEDEEVMTALMGVPGIGRWSAEVYLLFAMKRPDVWPAGDLAVVVALQKAKGLPERPTEKEMRRLAEAWRPHRSAAARLLWHAYRHPGVAFPPGE